MSIWHDQRGQAYHRRFVVINDMEDTTIAYGVYEDYETAVGSVMVSIWNFKESYKHEGDVFEIGDIEGGENGDFITIRFKASCWDDFRSETYQILYLDERKPELDKKKGERE